MKLIQKAIFCLFFLAGVPMLWWLIYHSVAQTYMFRYHGIEKQAMVEALDHTSSFSKGGIAFHYTLRVGDFTVVKGFLNQLPVGHAIPVLVLSDRPNEDELIIGTKSDRLFDTFANVFGGRVIAAIFVLLILPCLVVTTYLLPRVLKKVLNSDLATIE